MECEAEVPRWYKGTVTRVTEEGVEMHFDADNESDTVPWSKWSPKRGRKKDVSDTNGIETNSMNKKRIKIQETDIPCKRACTLTQCNNAYSPLNKVPIRLPNPKQKSHTNKPTSIHNQHNITSKNVVSAISISSLPSSPILIDKTNKSF